MSDAIAKSSAQPPRFVVFEGVDGSGKTTLAAQLASYYAAAFPAVPCYYGAFPGSEPGTIGEWVYRLHHGNNSDGLRAALIAPAALQLLHIAAHVDAISRVIAPTLSAGGVVVLDRYWWSTYAYVRQHLTQQQALRLVGAELPFWESLPRPVIIYLARTASLKPDELNQERQRMLEEHYGEIITYERRAGSLVHIIDNNGTVDDAWLRVLTTLTDQAHEPVGSHLQ